MPLWQINKTCRAFGAGLSKLRPFPMSQLLIASCLSKQAALFDNLVPKETFAGEGDGRRHSIPYVGAICLAHVLCPPMLPPTPMRTANAGRP